jgi:hypothetical protein
VGKDVVGSNQLRLRVGRIPHTTVPADKHDLGPDAT